MDWIFVPPLQIHIEILTPNVIVLEGRTSGRWLGHVGGAFVKEISALINETLESSYLLPPCEDTANKKADPHQTPNLPVPWSWISQL